MKSLLLILSRFRYFSPAWVFASLNIMNATWVLYIPRVKTDLAIDDGQLGIALFCFALGTLTMIPLAPQVSKKIGVGKATFLGVLLLSCSFLLPVIVPSYLLLCLSLYLTGMMACLTDVSMNALVSEIEQEDQLNFMSASHGFFSLGGVIGAGIGSLIINYFEVPFYHMLAATIFVIITNILVFKSYVHIKGKKIDREKKSFNMNILKPLLGIAVISFLIMGSEGAIEHWSKLYLKDVVLVISESIAGYGFVAFSITMTVGRFLGDSVSKRFGPLKIIIGGCMISIIGFGLVLLSELTLAIAGFGLIGLGFSVIIPELFRLAGKAKGVTPAEGISFIGGIGYAGFLLSPALLGFLSRIKDLTLSFTALLIATALALFISVILMQKRRN